MSATAHNPAAGAILDELAIVLVCTVTNPAGRSSFAESLAKMFDGVIVTNRKAGSRTARREAARKPVRLIPSCPFVVHAKRAGRRELELVLRAERRGWLPMISCREFRLSADHPEAHRVRVMPFNEPVYEPDPLGLSDPYILGQCRAEMASWGLVGIRNFLDRGTADPTPESVLRATAEAVQ